MRPVALLWFAVQLGFFSNPAFAQTQTPAPVQDPQAVAVLTQALTNAGGAASLGQIQDFSGSGTITYYQPSSVTGSVTVRGTTKEQFRLDAALASGIRSQAITNGQMTLKSEAGASVPLHAEVPVCPGRVVVPYILLTQAINSADFSLSYKGAANVAGHSVSQVELQEVIPGFEDTGTDFREYHTVDFFIDSSTFQILMMEDVVPKNLVRQIRFSNYQNVNGVLVPFSISEQSGGLPTWTIQLTQITFNTGLQDSDFQF